MHHYQVALPTPLFKYFTYASPSDLKRGQVVVVPLRKRSVIGVVVDTQSGYKGPVKDIIRTLPYLLNSKQMDFCTWLSHYTLTPLGQCMRMMMPLPLNEFDKLLKDIEGGKIKNASSFDMKMIKSIVLTPDQEQAAQKICHHQQQFFPALLDGITGSGKTEVYFKAIESLLAQGKQILVMLPEIMLSEQWIMRFKTHFGCMPFEWHSRVPPKRKRQIFQHIYTGNSCVVVGTRSSLLLPFQNLGLLVVDEEHDSSYKQEEKVIYNARDAAVYLAKLNPCPVVLASATPSLETYYNAVNHRYHHLKLKSRYGEQSLAKVHIIDQRTHDPMIKKSYITDQLAGIAQQALDRHEQVLFFVNKRGFSPLTLCRACGYRFECKSCSGWLIHHQKTNKLHCHHCHYQEPYPAYCPSCGTLEQLVGCGPGVEKVYEESIALFPTARHLVISSDLMESHAKRQAAIEQILAQEVDIMIGTQMMAKGHHFPHLTTIGLIDGDMGLSGMDLRACEKTFQMLTQVSGRAGREHLKGSVYLQTYNPDHPVIQAVQNHDRDAFYRAEMAQRKSCHMPPYSRLICITLSSLSRDILFQCAQRLAKKIPRLEGVQILGPTAPSLAMLRGQHRLKFLIITEPHVNRHAVVREWILDRATNSAIQVHIDVDPLSFS